MDKYIRAYNNGKINLMDNRGLNDSRNDSRNDARNEVRNQVRDLLPDLIAELTKQITQDVMVAMNSRISTAVGIAVKAEIKSALSGDVVSSVVSSAVESAVSSAVSSTVDEKVALAKRQITTEVAQTQLALSSASQRDLRNQVARDIASAINTNVMPQINNFMEGMADRNADHTEMITDYRRAVNSNGNDRTAARRAIKSSNANVMGRGFRQQPAITHGARGRGGGDSGGNSGAEPPNVQSLFSLEY